MEIEISKMVFSDPESCLLELQNIDDHSSFYSFLSKVNSLSDPCWRLIEAYLLYRLEKYEQLLNYLSKLDPFFHANVQFWILKGLSYRHLGICPDLAISSFYTALSIDSSRSDIHYNLANCFQDSDFFTSRYHYLLALDLEPTSAHIWHNFGVLLRDHRYFDDSSVALRRSIVLDPYNCQALCNLGLSYVLLEQYDIAERAFLLSISICPSFSQAYLNLGSLLLSMRRLEEAESYFLIPLTKDFSSPCTADLNFNLGLCHLITGRFTTGWIHYEHRLLVDQLSCSFPPSSGPYLSNLHEVIPPQDYPLVIWSEQGFGDTIQFCRYLLLLDDLNVKYDFYCQPELLSLVVNWLRPKGRIFPRDNKVISQHRLHCPLLSLPRIFASQLDTLPSSIPYLSSPPFIDVPTDLQIPPCPGGLSIGIVWSSSKSNARMFNNKSIPLSMLMPSFLKLMNLELINLHVLQIDDVNSQLVSWQSHSNLFNWSSKINCFADTAYLINQLDLVISVDTAVAHLSASLNRPTWTLLPFDSDFRWLLDRSDSPWYPGCMRLFRQSSMHDWSSIVSQINNTLDNLFMLDINRLSLHKSHLSL